MSVGAINKQTGERIPTAGMPAIDSVLSSVSTNPVQNRVVKAALDAITDGQSIDSFAEVETALGEKADTDIVASDFSTSASYTAGNYCIYDGKFYKFKNNHSGAWSAADVDEIKIAGELSSLMSGLTPQENFVVVNTEVIEDNSRFVVYKVGRTVFVSVSYAPKSGAIVSGAIIASQLPIPIQAWLLFDGVTQMILDTDGSLKFWYPSDTTTLTRRDFTFSYVSAS